MNSTKGVVRIIKLASNPNEYDEYYYPVVRRQYQEGYHTPYLPLLYRFEIKGQELLYIGGVVGIHGKYKVEYVDYSHAYDYEKH